MENFRNYDAPNAPQETQITFEMITRPDDHAGPPWESDEGFWPSPDPDAPGYVPPHAYDSEMKKAQARHDAYVRGDWGMVGIQARAVVSVPIGGGSFATYRLESPGLWGIEGDSGVEYLAEVFEEEKHALLAAMADIGQAASALLPASRQHRRTAAP